VYEPRTYRHWIKDKDLVSFTAVMRETDLHISAHSNLKPHALKAIKKFRKPLEKYIENHPLFLHSLEPFDVENDAPELVKDMANAARVLGVGPMAAVAGAIAEAVGKDLLAYSPEVIVENGGDIFMMSLKKRLIGIYAGSSIFTGKISLDIEPEDTPLGICTSSGTVGHSISFGAADAVIVLSPSTALADAAATAIGNHIKSVEDIEMEIERASHISGLNGLVIIKDDKIGIWGKVKLTSKSKDSAN
jgi:ApbE superfamily uncharacterized protein (UPF0280 family)